MGVVFERLKNRTMADYYKTIIQPRQVLRLTRAVQKTGVEAKREHTYQNRTGALESSISWVPAQIKQDTIEAQISAGGFSTVRFAYDISARRAGKKRRNRGVQLLVGRVNLKRGAAVYVNYAGFVEGRKRTVLTFFVKRNMPLFHKALGPNVSIERI